MIKKPDSIGGKRGPGQKKVKSYGRAAKVRKTERELIKTMGDMQT